MNQITFTGGRLGPFMKITPGADRYFCTGNVEVPYNCLPSGHFVQPWQGQLPEADPTPITVTTTQARFALIDLGIEDAFNTALAGVNNQRRRRRLTAEWNTAPMFARRGSALTAVLNQMNYTRAQIDEVYATALAQGSEA